MLTSDVLVIEDFSVMYYNNAVYCGHYNWVVYVMTNKCFKSLLTLTANAVNIPCIKKLFVPQEEIDSI